MFNIDDPLLQIGPLLILIVFFGGGIVNLFNWSTAKKFIESNGFKISSGLILGAAILWQFIGGLLTLNPSTAEVGCILLILFTVLSTLQFYQFWKKEGLNRYMDIIQFLSNLGVIGGLFLLLAHIYQFKFPGSLRIFSEAFYL